MAEGPECSQRLVLHHGLRAALSRSADAGEAQHLARGPQVQRLADGGAQAHLAQREDEGLRSQPFGFRV